MPRLDVFVCDCGCGAQRKESNHWFCISSGRLALVLSELDPGLEYSDEMLYLAGEQCVLKTVGEYMAGKLKCP